MIKKKKYDLMGDVYGNSSEVLKFVTGYGKEYSIKDVIEDTSEQFLLDLHNKGIENFDKNIMNQYLNGKYDEYSLKVIKYYKDLIIKNIKELIFNYACSYMEKQHNDKFQTMTNEKLEKILCDYKIDGRTSLEEIESSIECEVCSLEVLINELLKEDLNMLEVGVYKASNCVGTIYTFSFRGVEFEDERDWKRVCFIGGDSDIDYNRDYLLFKIEE